MKVSSDVEPKSDDRDRERAYRVSAIMSDIDKLGGVQTELVERHNNETECSQARK